MQVLCGLQGIFLLFNCQTPVHLRRLCSLYRFEIWRTQKKAGMASHRFQAYELDVFH